MKNPFSITEYLGPEYFCNRESETGRLINAFENQRNITLISLRRMGKTGLIKHVFHSFRKKENIKFLYVDLMPTNNINDFIRVLSRDVLKNLISKNKKLLKKTLDFFSRFRPVITIDSQTGQPYFEFKPTIQDESVNTIEQIFNFLKTQQDRLYIAFDEFQRISDYPEKNMEALLRSNIQFLHNINFIFSGSQRNMLAEMFGQNARPFYQSTETMYLEEINKIAYSEFIFKHFENAKSIISSDALELILTLTRGHTFYVQYLCNKIYSSKLRKVDGKIVREVFGQILSENTMNYHSFRFLLTNYQWSLMTAIAKEGSVTQIFSSEFINKHNLKASSSVNSAILSMLNKELVYEKNGAYFVYDVFMSEWLKDL